VAIRSTSPQGGVQVFNYGTITAPVTAISFNGSAGAANSVTLYGGSTTTGALEFNSLSGGETLEFAGAFTGNFDNTLSGLNVLKATGNSLVTMNSGSGYAFSNGMVDVESGSAITISGLVLNGNSPTSIAKNGAGNLTLTGVNTYTGGTFITSGTLWAKSAQALGTGNTSIGQGFGPFSITPSASAGTLLVSSKQEMGGNLLIGGNLDWYDGTIAYFDTGSSPLSGDLTINVASNFNVNTVGNATFDFSQVQALDAGTYTLVNATAVHAEGVTFEAAHGQYTTLFGNFTTTNNSVVYTVTGATSGGANIQNKGGPNTPVIANYNITTPTITIGENNTVNALTFSANNSLTINATGSLMVEAGNLTVQSGASVVSGGTLLAPNGFNKDGAGELDFTNNMVITGAAAVNEGLLSVNGNLTFSGGSGNITIGGNGTLGGNGSIAGIVLFAGGNLAPGNSPGNLTIGGNLVLTGANSTIIEIASPTNFDRITVTGQATLAGNMSVVQFGGYQLAYGQRYDILTAVGGITGEFARVLSSLEGKMASLR